MGTYVTVSIFDEDKSEEKKITGAAEMFKAIDRIEQIASRHLKESELNELNQQAVKDWFVPSPQLLRIVETGLRVAKICDGSFDPAIAPMLDLWQFKTGNPHKPSDEEIMRTLPLMNYRNVRIDSSKIRFAKPGMAIDLGGIAKGSAIDAAVNELIKGGFRDFMVDAGGDLAIHSSKLTRGKIRVWIRHPRKMELLFGYFFMDQGFVATSGDYEQYFLDEGKRYHHIINPETGYPDSDVISVTVAASTAELADAFATGIFVMGWDEGRLFAENHPELQVVILKQGTDKIIYWASESLMEKLQIVDDSLL